MISISKQYTFDSAHRLYDNSCSLEQNDEKFGKCRRLHGHTYTLTVEVTGEVDPDTGMVLNYFDLDSVVKPYVDGVLDHQFLNEVFPEMLTTAENMAEEIYYALFDRLDFGDCWLHAVTLQETPKTVARFVK